MQIPDPSQQIPQEWAFHGDLFADPTMPPQEELPGDQPANYLAGIVGKSERPGGAAEMSETAEGQETPEVDKPSWASTVLRGAGVTLDIESVDAASTDAQQPYSPKDDIEQTAASTVQHRPLPPRMPTYTKSTGEQAHAPWRDQRHGQGAEQAVPVELRKEIDRYPASQAPSPYDGYYGSDSRRQPMTMVEGVEEIPGGPKVVDRPVIGVPPNTSVSPNTYDQPETRRQQEAADLARDQGDPFGIKRGSYRDPDWT